MTGTRSPINLLGFEASDRLLGDLIKLLIVLSLIYIKCDHLAYLFVCYCTKFISRRITMAKKALQLYFEYAHYIFMSGTFLIILL